jgi:hypothetical protein
MLPLFQKGRGRAKRYNDFDIFEKVENAETETEAKLKSNRHLYKTDFSFLEPFGRLLSKFQKWLKRAKEFCYKKINWCTKKPNNVCQGQIRWKSRPKKLYIVQKSLKSITKSGITQFLNFVLFSTFCINFLQFLQQMWNQQKILPFNTPTAFFKKAVHF